jgi:hypothetical protein
MRSAIAGPVTPLLGSLGLHGAVALGLLIAVRHPARLPQRHLERVDAWAGNAVEVDAVATRDATANLPSGAPVTAHAEAAQAREPVAAPPSTARVNETDPAGPDQLALERAPVRPRVPRAQKPPEPSANAPAAPTSDSTSGAGSATPATGAFGAEGLPPGVRSLPSAFTRAITPATAADPIWQNLPVGSEHPFTIAIEVDTVGHISDSEIVREKDGSPPEAQATHVRDRVVALLGGGLFALQSDIGAGRELFRVTITLSDRPAHLEDDPAGLPERGFDPPRGSTPGRAYFTLTSGRHFEAKVQVLARP